MKPPAEDDFGFDAEPEKPRVKPRVESSRPRSEPVPERAELPQDDEVDDEVEAESEGGGEESDENGPKKRKRRRRRRGRGERTTGDRISERTTGERLVAEKLPLTPADDAADEDSAEAVSDDEDVEDALDEGADEPVVAPRVRRRPFRRDRRDEFEDFEHQLSEDDEPVPERAEIADPDDDEEIEAISYANVPTWEEAISYLLNPQQVQLESAPAGTKPRTEPRTPRHHGGRRKP